MFLKSFLDHQQRYTHVQCFRSVIYIAPAATALFIFATYSNPALFFSNRSRSESYDFLDTIPNHFCFPVFSNTLKNALRSSQLAFFIITPCLTAFLTKARCLLVILCSSASLVCAKSITYVLGGRFSLVARWNQFCASQCCAFSRVVFISCTSMSSPSCCDVNVPRISTDPSCINMGLYSLTSICNSSLRLFAL